MAQLRFSNYLVVAGVVLVVALSLSFTYVSPVGGAESKEVTVINTPLPVQGTVNVGNFPAVNAVTGSVSITGTPNVSVVNAPSSPVPVRNADDPDRNGFQATCLSSTTNFCTLTTVPAGKVLVIQGATIEVHNKPGKTMVATLTTILNNVFVNQRLGMQNIGPCHTCGFSPDFTPELYTAVLTFTVRADPGTNVFVTFQSNDAEASPVQGIIASLSGYFVSVP